MTPDDSVRPVIFNTESLDAADQVAAWREWFSPIFDISPVASNNPRFSAENKVWDIGGILLSRSAAPATYVTRGKLNISKNPVDHWVITYNRHGETSIATDRTSLHASAGVPFLWSLGERTSSERSSVDRIQLLIPRDMFREISSLLDASRGSVLNTPLGRMLGDYMIFLESRLCSVAAGDLPRLAEAVRSMIAACVAPSAERSEVAAKEIELGRRERVCRVIHSQLRSAALTPASICRSVGISRSQLYRLFEHSGGVQRYIKRQRLLQSHAILSDPDNAQPVLSIAQGLCFEDASSFSRAFRREFGHSPSDVKSAAAAGMPLTIRMKRQGGSDTKRFADLLTAASLS
jgi:AraC-like DNA-binding protein